MLWYEQNARPLPWRFTKDPYKIWLSEIILQQTQVAQGLPYYQEFVNKYPSVFELAKAHDDEVFSLWQGLGYYSRARNLLKTARWVAFENNGNFPETAQKLALLPGIGPYTAAAIASFAFGETEPALDGNAFRVLSRLYNLELPIDAPTSRKVYRSLAIELMRHAKADLFNQAIMELGATICKPNPKCEICPVFDCCEARAMGNAHKLPFKSPPKPKKELTIRFALVLNEDGQVFVKRRPSKGIWSNLYEFPNWLENYKEQALFEIEHVLTHRKLHIQVAFVTGYATEIQDCISVRPTDLINYGFPVPLLRALKHYGLYP